MVRTDRFLTTQTYKQPEIQRDSPVYIHCSRRCTEQATGAVLLQVRLVNRTNEPIKTVVLQIEGLSEYGVVLYTMRDVILSECHAQPHSMFGEDKILALEHTPVHRVRISVESVVYDDGMIWRRGKEQTLEDARQVGWSVCTCAMRNPPEAAYCELCGRALKPEMQEAAPMQTSAAEDFPEIQVPYLPVRPPEQYNGMTAPMPHVRTPAPAAERPYEPEEDEGMPKGLVVVLSILGIAALLAVTGFLAYIFMQYLGKI